MCKKLRCAANGSAAAWAVSNTSSSESAPPTRTRIVFMVVKFLHCRYGVLLTACKIAFHSTPGTLLCHRSKWTAVFLPLCESNHIVSRHIVSHRHDFGSTPSDEVRDTRSIQSSTRLRLE